MARRRKAHQAGGHSNAERWLLTYADMITLLMVFFVVLFAMSTADTKKYAKLRASLDRAFRVEVLQGDVPSSLNGQDGSSQAISVIQEAITLPGSDSRLIGTLSDLRQALLAVPQPAPNQGKVELGTARDGVVISLSGNVLFDSGRADLKPDGLILLDALAEKLRELPNPVRIEGHTDNTPIATALFPSNWELSAARATTVARYLAEQGIDPRRLSAAGYGEFRPAAPNDTREGRARNRRVDIVIIFPESPPPQVGPVRSVTTGGGS